ncbi:hypothetical protein [Noviherbaspirillum massiliense]|uniref:hypothetical protein n=1 Tax=Noviherbaspirillum massiliense TaxID=1465823 RepID=UPI0002E94F3F|nr:hypothetical protein [Noviherbaspirillum massiliense]
MPEAVQKDDIHVRAIIWIGVALAAMIAVACAIAYGIWSQWRPAGSYDGPNAAFDFKVEKPVLDSAPQPAREAYFAEKEKRLNSYAWVDRQAGIARIPIQRAMELMAQRGVRRNVPEAPQEKAAQERQQ